MVLGLALLVMLTSPGSHPQPAQAQTTAAPKWVLSIDSSEVATFSKGKAVSGILVPETTSTVGQAPKPVSVVLERNANGSQALSTWHQLARAGDDAARKDAILTYYDSNGTPTLKLFLEKAFPSEIRYEQRGARLVEGVTLTAPDSQRQSLP